MSISRNIIVAIDETDPNLFKKIVDSLDSDLCMVKIGSVSFNAIGQDALSYAAKKGFEIFLDLKFHDIPNTVKKSISGLSSLPIKMLTVHTSGGLKMMESAMEAVSNSKILVFGVTVLTSLTDNDTSEVYKRKTEDQFLKMLKLAERAGIDGIVCSPKELKLMSKSESLMSITPGIRIDNLNDDQQRTMSPKEAIDQGADYIVIGRPITKSNNISDTLKLIYNSIT
tara:strand:+ start:3186 stop:3863 length:678 start_codon:yes stop_codon:yes gene_type:complete